MVLSFPSNKEQPLMMKLKETFAFLRGTLRAKYSPSDLLKFALPLGFHSGIQQDCSEFLKYLLDTLHEPMVQKAFGGKLQATYECLNCKSVSLQKEGFTNLLLAIPDPKNNSETTTIGK